MSHPSSMQRGITRARPPGRWSRLRERPPWPARAHRRGNRQIGFIYRLKIERSSCRDYAGRCAPARPPRRIEQRVTPREPPRSRGNESSASCVRPAGAAVGAGSHSAAAPRMYGQRAPSAAGEPVSSVRCRDRYSAILVVHHTCLTRSKILMLLRSSWLVLLMMGVTGPGRPPNDWSRPSSTRTPRSRTRPAWSRARISWATTSSTSSCTSAATACCSRATAGSTCGAGPARRAAARPPGRRRGHRVPEPDNELDARR